MKCLIEPIVFVMFCDDSSISCAREALLVIDFLFVCFQDIDEPETSVDCLWALESQTSQTARFKPRDGVCLQNGRRTSIGPSEMTPEQCALFTTLQNRNSRVSGFKNKEGGCFKKRKGFFFVFFFKESHKKSRFVLVPEAGDVYVETSEMTAGEEAQSNQA